MTRTHLRALATERNVRAAILAAIAMLAVLVVAGCCSSTARDHARRALVRAELLQAASVANPSYDEAGRVAYVDLWTAHLEHLRALAELTNGSGDVKGTARLMTGDETQTGRPFGVESRETAPRECEALEALSSPVTTLPITPCSRCEGTGLCPCWAGWILMVGEHPCWQCEGTGRQRS